MNIKALRMKYRQKALPDRNDQILQLYLNLQIILQEASQVIQDSVTWFYTDSQYLPPGLVSIRGKIDSMYVGITRACPARIQSMSDGLACLNRLVNICGESQQLLDRAGSELTREEDDEGARDIRSFIPDISDIINQAQDVIDLMNVGHGHNSMMSDFISHLQSQRRTGSLSQADILIMADWLDESDAYRLAEALRNVGPNDVERVVTRIVGDRY